MKDLNKIITDFSSDIISFPELLPWEITEKLFSIIIDSLGKLKGEYKIQNNIAIHKSAKVSPSATVYGPVIICADAMIGENALLRNGVILGKKSIIGHSCEIKQSVIFHESSVAHFNFVGNSLIGSLVNLEAGVIVCNSYNERSDKTITVNYDGRSQKLPTTKFGAIIGDNCKIGSNSVLSPGTILLPNTVVGRLELVEQNAVA